MPEPDVLVNLHATLGEGPIWDHRNGVLLWVDILSGHLHRTDPDNGSTNTIPLGTPIGAVALSDEDDYLLATRSGFARFSDGGLSTVAEVIDDADVRMNDGALDPAGRFLAGSMAGGATPGGGRLYSLDADGRVRTLIESVTISNGLAWSDDGRRMLYVDSATQRVDEFDYDPDTGTMTDRKPFVSVPEADGIPDGITLDEEGCLWVAFWGGARVRRYSPTGQTIDEIAFPVTQVTSCAFGGERLDRLYVTSAAVNRPRGEGRGELDGALFVVDPGCRGRREPVARGRTQ